MQPKAILTLLLTLLGVTFTPFAQAHIVTAESMGLISGLVHPLTGIDHILAAVAVGLWAALSGGASTRSVAAVFLVMLGLGAVAGFAGIPLALVEPALALSLIAVGALIALRVCVTRVTGLAVAGGFAFFHGYAHTMGLPVTANAVWYGLGLLLSTALLLVSGIALGRWLAKRESRVPVRLAGGLVALIGSMLLIPI
jgi:urease accessory protein